MTEVIISNQNKTIKNIKALHNKKYRDSLGQYIIEGYKLIEEAFQYERPFSLILLSEEAANTEQGQSLSRECHELNIPIYFAEERVFKEVSEMDSPQGVLAVLLKQEHRLESIMGREAFILTLLDEVRDPGNVGTIIRTADACGIDAVILSKGCVDLYNGKTIRATMGSMFHIPVITDVDMPELIEKLKQADAEVLGADPHSDISCIDVPHNARTAIVIGNEAKGMRAELKAATTQNITIPMPGKAESLNAGIAAAILMYEFAVRKSR
ncbi:MAG: rlmB [Clostridia bacterium]|jgi:TrmH family RNA methyltransferase|nr:rlmB [Clostridia bacterium]